ncbi:FMN-dependent NADH-azoreductase [Oceanomicrobium pacificus]|uniref:FMN dependent NADH:quinone oxidoreductase n=1 Tax=Oceanomicrobium pacificus TaxID=2692916 RepID=A0A6B0TSA3_9RHOB|nr:NAD(P)H-dependent oxidoreductase [Oceanomicrobium pacificus]MXU64082.1 FMN-dependent NADH-azoreductase [Oceanomicrobium pacificus]
MTHTLIIHSSARKTGSVTRDLSRTLAETLGGTVTERDLADGIALIDEPWIGANFAGDAATDADHARLAGSEELVAELEAADTIVIGLPIYNFSVPAALKAWVDQVARARRTFRYTETGPEGLLTGKKAYLVVASGGVPVDSPVDFATPYMRHLLGFIGISDVTVIGADAAMVRGDAARAEAEAAIAALAPAKAA